VLGDITADGLDGFVQSAELDDVLLERRAADVRLLRLTTQVGGHDQATGEHLVQVAFIGAGPMCTSSVLLNSRVMHLWGDLQFAQTSRGSTHSTAACLLPMRVGYLLLFSKLDIFAAPRWVGIFSAPRPSADYHFELKASPMSWTEKANQPPADLLFNFFNFKFRTRN
jgi:hypothetical protein